MRIAIVNDSPLAVEALSRLLTRSAGHELAWTARDGEEAIAACHDDLPDLILMDLVMPGPNGVETTRRIMGDTPCPILIVTASVDRNTAKIFDALGAGALDVVATPVLGANGHGEGGEALLSKIRIISRLITGRAPIPSAAPAPRLLETTAARNRLVAIGASAGGPAALATLLSGLPKDFPAAIVIIQHVDTQFSGLMSKWLNGQSALPVRIAGDDDCPEAGTVLLAGGNNHLIFSGPRRLCRTAQPESCCYRPSVDVFFESVARHWKGETTGVLLTGMGRDGAKGLKMLRDHGALTIAQDQATSTVYGMPKAAAELGAAVEVLPLGQIAPRLIRHYSSLNPLTHDKF